MTGLRDGSVDHWNWHAVEYCQKIDLILSDYKKELIDDTDERLFTANDRDYADSDEHKSVKFLGWKFKSITCRGITYPKD